MRAVYVDPMSAEAMLFGNIHEGACHKKAHMGGQCQGTNMSLAGRTWAEAITAESIKLD